MNGLVLIDKPRGWTSFDVVHKVRRLVQNSPHNTSNKKRFPVGHTGTLDPLATGLLVLLLGSATKQAMALTKLDKVYEVTMKLGDQSSTGDEEGQKYHVSDQVPTREDLQNVLARYSGDIEQIPPAFSAVKVNGQRAYKLARAGKAVQLSPRTVHIYSLDNVSYDYPLVRFRVKVSSGTYIRTLVEDIGNDLQTGAYMTRLCRTEVGPYSVKDALRLTDEVTADTIQHHLASLA